MLALSETSGAGVLGVEVGARGGAAAGAVATGDDVPRGIVAFGTYARRATMYAHNTTTATAMTRRCLTNPHRENAV